MAELWDAYDKDLKKIEDVTLIRGEDIPQGMFHLVVSIIVKHRDGTYLLMQRDYKKSHGGHWELSAGGSVLQGENAKQGALREIREETGIVFEDLRQLKTVAKEYYQMIFCYFIGITDCKKGDVVYQEGETINHKWVTLEELKNFPEEELESPFERNMVFEMGL